MVCLIFIWNFASIERHLYYIDRMNFASFWEVLKIPSLIQKCYWYRTSGIRSIFSNCFLYFLFDEGYITLEVPGSYTGPKYSPTVSSPLIILSTLARDKGLLLLLIWIKSLLVSSNCFSVLRTFILFLCHIKLFNGTFDRSLWVLIKSSGILEYLKVVNISCFQSQPSSSGALKPYLDAVRATLLVATCLRNFPSQNVERHNKPEVEVR